MKRGMVWFMSNLVFGLGLYSKLNNMETTSVLLFLPSMRTNYYELKQSSANFILQLVNDFMDRVIRVELKLKPLIHKSVYLLGVCDLSPKGRRVEYVNTCMQELFDIR